MSLFISGRKLFPRRPQQTSSGPIGQNQITCSPLNQSPIGLCAGALLPRIYCWSIPGKKQKKTTTTTRAPGAREKWEVVDGQAINNVSQPQSGAEQVAYPRQRLCGRRSCEAWKQVCGTEGERAECGGMQSGRKAAKIIMQGFQPQ